MTTETTETTTDESSENKQTTPETRSLFEVKDKHGGVWDTRKTRQSAEDMRRNMEIGDDMEGVSINEVTDVQNRYHLKNDETGEEMAVFSFYESEAVREAWLEWGIIQEKVSIEDVEEFDKETEQ